MSNSENETINDIKKACRLAVFCRRGDFYPDKDYGSKIREAAGNTSLALAYARLATADIDGIYIKSADINGSTLTLSVYINGELRQVETEFETDIQ